MARVRYLGPEPVTVPELGRAVEPDESVEVPDERFGAYVCQTANWEAVEEPADYAAAVREPLADRPAAPPTKRTGAKPVPQQKED